MVVATQPGPVIAPPEADRLRLSGISWETYEHLIIDLERAGRPLKLAYDRGKLEIETPTKWHEIIKTFVSQLLEHYLIASGGGFLSVGEATWKRSERGQGLESDACYYIQSRSIVGSGEDIDLERDPPPDLAVEVEVAHPLVDKLSIYYALGIPELWHVRAPHSVQFLRRDPASTRYVPIEVSDAVPAISSDWVQRHIQLRASLGNAEAIRSAVAELVR